LRHRTGSYKNAVADSVMLYLQHDFCDIIFKTRHKLYIASGSTPPPPPPRKNSGRTHYSCHTLLRGLNAFLCISRDCFCDVCGIRYKTCPRNSTQLNIYWFRENRGARKAALLVWASVKFRLCAPQTVRHFECEERRDKACALRHGVHH
jgi:hypothetical protein